LTGALAGTAGELKDKQTVVRELVRPSESLNNILDCCRPFTTCLQLIHVLGLSGQIIVFLSLLSLLSIFVQGLYYIDAIAIYWHMITAVTSNFILIVSSCKISLQTILVN